jgi:tRNA dimethylallyltransferase
MKVSATLRLNIFGKKARPKVLMLTGPAGVDIADTSIILAERLNGEIVSADTLQVYTGMDICSDKLPLDKRRGVHSFSFR